MSTTSDRTLSAGGGLAPQSVAAALAMVDAGLGYLRDPGAASLLPSELGEVLAVMGGLGSKFTAARATILNHFDAERAR